MNIYNKIDKCSVGFASFSDQEIEKRFDALPQKIKDAVYAYLNCCSMMAEDGGDCTKEAIGIWKATVACKSLRQIACVYAKREISKIQII